MAWFKKTKELSVEIDKSDAKAARAKTGQVKLAVNADAGFRIKRIINRIGDLQQRIAEAESGKRPLPPDRLASLKRGLRKNELKLAIFDLEKEFTKED